MSNRQNNFFWIFVFIILVFMLGLFKVNASQTQEQKEHWVKDAGTRYVVFLSGRPHGGKRMIKVAVTGHRPERIIGRQNDIKYWLEGQIKNLLACYDEVLLIDGMAPGVDQLAALAALKVGAQVSCYFPYKKKLHDVQKYIVENAKECRYMYEKFQDGCFIDRDRRMVDDCDILIVVWDGKKYGGTYATYRYAFDRGKNILIYPWN